MTYEDIMNLQIEHVSESAYGDEDSIFIFFELDGIECQMEAYCSADHVYLIPMISYGRKRFCPYCHQEETYCYQLDEHRKTIFERVIQSKSIRLNWLYREYRSD